MRRVETIEGHDGTVLACSTEGSGPPIVLCDGIGCDHYVWRQLKPILLERFRVISWNYRGHGHSESPADPDAVTIEHHREDLLSVLDHYDIPSAIMLGHSMGVQVILDFYGAHPKRVRALVPICGASGHPLDTFNGDMRFKERVFPWIYRLLTAGNSPFTHLWRSLFPTPLGFRLACMLEINGSLVRKEDFRPYLQHMARMDLDLFGRTLRAAAEHSADHILPRIKVPTLIFAGEKDGFTPANVSREMHRQIPGAELCVVPGGSHTAPLEVPELLQLRLEKFFRDHSLQRAPRRRSKRRQA